VAHFSHGIDQSHLTPPLRPSPPLSAQAPFEESNPTLAETRAHSGFLAAYKSVQGAVLQTLHSLLTLDGEGEGEAVPWDIYVTGHSLGGALATLCAFDLGRMRAGLWGEDAPLRAVATPNAAAAAAGAAPGDGAAAYRSDPRFLAALRGARLVKYSYGAPRVGCPAFAQLYDTMVPDSFRVVNNADVVARIPRSSKVRALECASPFPNKGHTALPVPAR